MRMKITVTNLKLNRRVKENIGPKFSTRDYQSMKKKKKKERAGKKNIKIPTNVILLQNKLRKYKETTNQGESAAGIRSDLWAAEAVRSVGRGLPV